MKKLTNTQLSAVIVAAVAVIVVGFLVLGGSSDTTAPDSQNVQINSEIPQRLATSGLNTDFTRSSIDLTDVLSGGPGKDGIPSIDDPQFVQQQDSNITDDVEVIFVENNGEQKIYPYNVLVWHEIVNDTVGGKPLAITFCPLCGSAIVFDRELNGEVVEFGVSGFLYQSNLLMYSRDATESLFSQSRGEAVVGELTGTKLTYFPLELLTMAEARELYPNATVLSDNTGYNRDYTQNPYSGYEDTEATYFPVANQDTRYSGKEVFYIVPLDGGRSIAVRQEGADGTYPVENTDVSLVFDRGRITANSGDQELPGYFEMWFSWATHNQQTGIVFDQGS